MAAHRAFVGLLCAAAAGGGISAQPILPETSATAPKNARFGIVRVRIEPGIGEQEAEIRQLLAAHSFVRISEPADYLVTTKPDFPLDLTLVDLRQPAEHWIEFDRDHQPKAFEPRNYTIGNLREEDTGQKLASVLVAASRLRAILDRSTMGTQGVETCVLVKRQGKADECAPLSGPGAQHFISLGEVGGLGVLNRSDGDRYVSTLAADGSLRIGWFGLEDAPPVVKLAPGEGVEFQPRMAGLDIVDDPRILLLVSARPFNVDELKQADPIKPDVGCGAARHAQGCSPASAGITMSEDMAVRSFQLIVSQEPRPAMGNGSDVTAAMAAWMAQFYSIHPYKQAEIDADSKLPEDKKQYLSLRSYEERQHRCGATLIATDVVLTAAHCVAKGQYAGDGLAKLFKDRRVRLGTRRLGKEGQSFGIAGVAVHAGYVPDQQKHDLALLLLRPDRGSGNVRQQPIAVADRPLPASMRWDSAGASPGRWHPTAIS